MSTQAIYRTHRLALSAKSLLEVAQGHAQEMPDGELKQAFHQRLLCAIKAMQDLNTEFHNFEKTPTRP
jgi:hypothetical protein